MKSKVQTPADEAIFYAPFIWIKMVKQKSDNRMFQPPGSVACAENPLWEGGL
jgi:hypothetical protein